jgi:hypothetical protein
LNSQEKRLELTLYPEPRQTLLQTTICSQAHSFTLKIIYSSSKIAYFPPLYEEWLVNFRSRGVLGTHSKELLIYRDEKN